MKMDWPKGLREPKFQLSSFKGGNFKRGETCEHTLNFCKKQLLLFY
jgi:hypothetical protein